MPFLQEWIHKLEVGAGTRYLKIIAAVLAVLVVVGGYNIRSYRNLGSEEAMDAAQVARNVSEGNGFKTQYIRPFSIHLVKSHNEKSPPVSADGLPDYAQLKEMHPDLANAPAYPLLLAGWMKVYPLFFSAAEGIRSIMPGIIKGRLPRFDLEPDGPLWQKNKRFWWAPHDFMIAMLNEAIFFVVIWLAFLLARRLFDRTVAWVTALMLFGSEMLWHFSVSGLPTMLMLLIFMGLVWCVVLFESEVREPKAGPKRLLLLSGAIGLLVGVGMMTRYSFGWLIIPLLVFLILLGGQQRLMLCGLALGLFLLVVTPWIVRNVSVSGTPFGTAGYSMLDGIIFSGNRLDRSLDPHFEANYVRGFISKLLVNGRSLLGEEVPRLSGGWATAFFLAGLLLPFNNPTTRRLRYFILGCLGTFVLVQALGKSHLSNDVPIFNSENLLVLLSPVIVMFGVAFFFVLLDQINFVMPVFRWAVVGLFVALCCLPMLSTFLPPRGVPFVAPYSPPTIRMTSEWMKEKELMMSDMPWAVAWYGNRQAVLLTLNPEDDFFAINDYLKPIGGLYLTPLTMDSRFLSEWFQAGEKTWGEFIVQGILLRRLPEQFPLRIMPPPEYSLYPMELFLTDRDRWKTLGSGNLNFD